MGSINFIKIIFVTFCSITACLSTVILDAPDYICSTWKF